jgi:hypothetical protein
MHLEKCQLGRRNSTFYTNIASVITPPCPHFHRVPALSLRIQANSSLNTNAAISTRGLQLTFGGGGSRKQVNIFENFIHRRHRQKPKLSLKYKRFFSSPPRCSLV